jgi:hypothetical protein
MEVNSARMYHPMSAFMIYNPYGNKFSSLLCLERDFFWGCTTQRDLLGWIAICHPEISIARVMHFSLIMDDATLRILRGHMSIEEVREK